MRLTDLAIKRPIFMSMALLSLVLFGTLYFFRMGIDLFPKVDLPIITVVSVLPGADPETTELMVTDPIEEAISTISSIKNLRSKSGEGISQLIVEFELEKNIDIAYQEVQARLGAIRSTLPNDLIAPVIQKIDFDALPVLSIFLSGPFPIETLTEIAKKEVKESLQRLPNVGEIRLVGGREKKMWLYLNRDQLQSHHLTIAEVEQALKFHHVEIPGGRLQTSNTETPVKVMAEFSSSEECADWIIADRKGAIVRIKDLGSVVSGLEEERSASQLNDTSAIALLVQRQSGSNTVEVAQAIKKACVQIKESLASRNICLQVAQDSSIYIHNAIDEVYFHLLFGGGLAILIVLIFLRNTRSTLVCALALPAAVIGTFSFMYLLGFTQNMMTLLALSIAIGLLIDDAIVVQENIMRHIELGLPPKEAASQATKQIAMAVLATTLSIVSVFVPVAFVKGMIGRFFYQFGMTIVCAALLSLFISFTLNPMFSAHFLRQPKTGRLYHVLERFFRSLERIYGIAIRWSLRHRLVIVGIALFSFIGALGTARYLRFEFQPQEDRSEFQITIEVPKGSAIDVTKNLAQRVRTLAQNRPWVEYTFTTVGGNQMHEVHKATIYVKMIDKSQRTLSQDLAMNELRELLTTTGEEKVIVEPFNRMGSLSNYEVMLEIKGPDLNRLATLADQLKDRLNHSAGYRDIHTSHDQDHAQIEIFVRRDRAADLGVTPLMVASTIRTAIGGSDVAKFKEGQNRYNMGIRLAEPFRQSIDQIELLSVKNNMGKLIPLKNVIEVNTATGTNEINRTNRSRQITLFANLDHREKVIGTAMNEVQTMVQEMGLPAGYSIDFAGQAKMFRESFSNLVFALLLAIIILYMVLASQFESLSLPFIIMLSLPLSVVGALGALVLSGTTMCIFSMIGMIMLMGLVTKNGILLVDRINLLYHKEGLPLDEAICSSGQQRLRPILMTTLSIIFGMLPVALGVGSGSESQVPMAIAVIGGLITSTLLTLIVIPVVYSLFVREKRATSSCDAIDTVAKDPTD